MSAGPAAASGAAGAPTPTPQLRCTLTLAAPVAARGPVKLRMQWTNSGPKAMHVLTWGTPFEGGWFGPWLEVHHQGQALPYQGVMVKRGAPEADDYLRLNPSQRRQATVDLAEAFDLSRPGRYEVRPKMVLHDVQQGARKTTASGGGTNRMALPCPGLEFERPG